MEYINDVSEEEKILALQNITQIMKQYETMRNTVSNIVYELKNRYDNENETEKFCIDIVSQYVKNHGRKHNYVYFFRNKYNNFVKIGCTTDLVKRYGDIRSICKNYIGMEDALLTEGAIDTSFIKPEKIEKYLHEKYKKYRKFGEWFEFPKDVWDEIYHLFIDNDNFIDMTNDKDIEKLNVQNKIHNIIYIDSSIDKEFSELLSECSKRKEIGKELIETYIDKITNMLSGIHFRIDLFDEDEAFYRLLYMNFMDKFVEKRVDLYFYTFQHMKDYYIKQGIISNNLTV